MMRARVLLVLLLGACSRRPEAAEPPPKASVAEPLKTPPVMPPVEATPQSARPEPTASAGPKPCPGARTPRVGKFPYRARAMMTIKMVFVKGFTPDAELRKAIEADGRTRIDDAERAIISPPAPQLGWVRVGARSYMIERNGSFFVPDMPASTTKIEIWREVTSGPKEATLTLDRCGFEATEQDAPTYMIEKKGAFPPGPMD